MKRLLCALTLAILFACSAGAALDVCAEQRNAIDLDGMISAMPEQARQAVGSEALEQAKLDTGLKNIGNKAMELFLPSAAKAFADVAKLLGILLICGVCAGTCESGGKYVGRIVDVAGVLAVATVTMITANSLMQSARELMSSANAFADIMIPSLAAASAAAGAPGNAIVWQTCFMLCADILIKVIGGALMPAMFFFLALKAVAAATGQKMLSKSADLLKSMVSGALKLMMTAFIAYITVSGIMGGAADGVIKRTAKFALSASVPIVGGALADAADSILAGAAMIRNYVGIAGLLGILAICVAPIVGIGAYYLVFKMSAIFLAPISTDGIASFFDAVTDSFAIILGMCSSCVLLLLLSIIAAVTIGT